MPELRTLTQMRLKVKDLFVLKDVVKILEEWFKENKYVDLEGGDDYETLYTHCIKAGGSFLDAQLWWRAVKYPRGTTKDTAYLRYRIDVDMHYLGDANETEVVAKGKKIKVYKGEITFLIRPTLDIDFRDEWGKKGLLGMVSDVFKKKIYKKEIDAHIVFILTEASRLQNMLKQFFRLETAMPEETVSQYPKGLMQ